MFEFQSGFRTNYSTETCISFLHDKILKGFDQGLLTGMIAIDLQKAFDTIDHSILLEKLDTLGFSTNAILWFKSYLTKRTFCVSLNDYTSSPAPITCGVPQGSILGPLLFLLYINDMPQAVKSHLLLYADDSCLLFQHKSIDIINQKLNEDFSSLCDWFIDNKLSIHFGEDKTKCILFGSKRKLKKVGNLIIKYKEKTIKQYPEITYLGCILDENMSGEAMALKVIRKINNKLRFLYRKNQYLSTGLRRLLCNALIQPHFDYVATAWYLNLNKKLKKRLQSSQNNCLRFCLQLENRQSINMSHYIKINWLPTTDRVNQCICSHVFKFFQNSCPSYMSQIFNPAEKSSIITRRSHLN